MNRYSYQNHSKAKADEPQRHRERSRDRMATNGVSEYRVVNYLRYSVPAFSWVSDVKLANAMKSGINDIQGLAGDRSFRERTERRLVKGVEQGDFGLSVFEYRAKYRYERYNGAKQKKYAPRQQQALELTKDYVLVG